MIKLFSKKRLGFRDPDTKDILTVQPLAFETVPDWVANDPMFEMAIASGSLTVASDIPKKPAVKRARKTVDEKEAEAKEAEAKEAEAKEAEAKEAEAKE